MARPNVQDRWWVESGVKKPRQERAQLTAQLPVAMSFYSVARDYDQDRAKEHLTANNLNVARALNPSPGQWSYLAMTEEHYSKHLIKRIKDEFRLPGQASGIVIDHGRLLRLLICGPQVEDWMIDLHLGEEPSVDVYVWNTLYRERLCQRAEEALRLGRRWALNLIQYPPQRDDPFRGALL